MSMAVKLSYVCWLEKYDWKLIGTLTFRKVRSLKTAQKLLCGWIASLEACESAVLGWVRMAEYGRADHRLHFHVVIAGARRVTPEVAEKIWGQMAGIAVVRLYDRKQRGLSYMLKSIEDGPDFLLEIGNLREEHLRRRQLNPRLR
jgi:hypothetical protein